MKPRFSPSCDRFCVKMAGRFASERCSLFLKKTNDKTTRLSQNIVGDLSVSCRSIMFATDKSPYFAQPREASTGF